MTSSVGYIMFGGEPASEDENDYHNYIEMEIDDIRFADTYSTTYNWFDEYRHLYNVTPPELYSEYPQFEHPLYMTDLLTRLFS